MELKIGIQANNLSAGAAILNQFLADESVLYYKTKIAHWNVEGPGFFAMHKFFETQYEQLDEIMDELAERIRTLGYYAGHSLQQHIRYKEPEQSESKYEAETLINQLLLDHEKLVVSLRENINCFAVELDDMGTSDFITGLMEIHEKMAWMLRAHLK